MTLPGTVDCLVIGSGAGGLAAAIQARLAGLDVLVAEKTSLVGGSTALSGGILWLPCNPLLAREGVADSRQAALDYLANFTSDSDLVSTPARRAAFVDATAPIIATFERAGMQYRRCAGYSDYYDHLPGGHAAGRSIQAELFDLNELGPWKSRFRRSPQTMPLRTSEARPLMMMTRTWEGRRAALRLGLRLARQKLTGTDIVGSGAALQGRMLQLALKLGADVRTDTALESLIVSGGRVTGAILVQDGQRCTITARRGVLVAAGGFARNLAMRERYQPLPASDSWTKANPGDTGEAIVAMEAAGAALGLMHEAWWIPSSIAPGEDPHHAVLETCRPFGIMVDSSGQRFANESASYMEVGQAIYTRHRTVAAIPAWFVMDARNRRRYPWRAAPPGRTPESWTESGWMKQADTLPALAAACGIDPAGLVASVERFNGFCATGVDADFGRGSNVYNRYYGDPTVKPNPCLGPIEQGPFQAIPLWPGDAGTAGGACINEHAQVLRADASPIEGLYAAGNSTASLSGPFYAGAGLSIGASTIFGAIAARHMAGETGG